MHELAGSGVEARLSSVARLRPIKQAMYGQIFLIPATAYVTDGEEGAEVRGPGLYLQAGERGDLAVLAVPKDESIVDRFVSITSIRLLYHIAHVQKWQGVVVPHDTHTLAAEQGSHPYAEYVQAVTFAKVTGEMIHPITGKITSCAILNVRMPQETYGGQLWWVIGGHNIPHERGSVEDGAYKRGASSIGGTLGKENREEALIVRESTSAETPFDPRQKEAGRKCQVLGYGRSSDRVGKVHEAVVVAVHLAKGEKLVVRDSSESLGFIQVPLASWMRFMRERATPADRRVIRRCVIDGLEQELARVPQRERPKRRALVERELTLLFGERLQGGARAGFYLTPEQHTPPIDRLSLSAMHELAQTWRLLPWSSGSTMRQ